MKQKTLVFLFIELFCSWIVTIPFLYAQIQPELFIQLGHYEVVHSVCFSPDGKSILSAGKDRTIKLWSFETGKEIRTFTGHTDEVTSVVFFPDGRYIVSGSADRTVRVWDVLSGKTVRSWQSHNEKVTSVKVSPDGLLIASGSKDKTIKLWSLDNQWEIRTLKGHRSGVNSLAFSSDGKFLVSGSGDDYLNSTSFDIKLWNVENGTEVRTFEGHTGLVDSVNFSPNGKQIISCSWKDRTLRIWDVQTGKLLRKANDGFIGAAFSPDGRYILGTRFALNGMMLYDSLTGKHVDTFKPKDVFLRSSSFSPDSRYIVYGGDKGNVGVIDLTQGTTIQTLSGEVEPIYQVGFTSDQKRIVASSYSTIHAWNLDSLPNSRFWTKLEGHHSAWLSIEKATLSPAGNLLAVSDSGKIELVDPNNGKIIWVYSAEGQARYNPVRFLAFTPDGKRLIALRSSGGTDGTIEILDTSRGKLLKSIQTYYGLHTVFALSPDGKQMLMGEGNLSLYDLEKWQETFKLPGHSKPIKAKAFAPDGNSVATGGEDKQIKVWDLKTGNLIHTLTGHTNTVTALQISPDGNYLVSGADDNTLRIWNLATGTEIHRLTGHKHRITSITFSKEGDRFLSGSWDGTVRLWDTKTGKELAQFVYFTDKEWIVSTPEGYFEASPNGAKHLNVRIGSTLYSMDNFFDTFYNPSAVASVLQGTMGSFTSDIRKGILPPPEVSILQPLPNAQIQEDQTTVVVQAKDLGGGIGEIRLYHNGKLVGDTARGLQVAARSDELRMNFTIQLLEGINTFRAVAFSKDRIESLPAEIQVHCQVPTKGTTLHLLAIGINQYRNAALNLNYAEPDARSIVSFFKKGNPLFKEVQSRELYNQEATKERILEQLKKLQSAQPQDAVLIYLAGHGEVYKDLWYFLPHDLVYPEREEEVKEKGISSSELASLLKGIPAQKILVLIDTCKAGGALVAFRGYEDRKALQQLSRATGIHIIAASTKDQYAAELAELQHGVFTYALLEGLRGKAATSSRTVTARSLMAYVENTLPELTQKYYQQAQYPVVDSRGMDFPVYTTR